MPYRHTLLFLLATLTTINVSAWSRMGTAAVMTEAGLPCFKIASEEEHSRGPVSLKMLTISTPGPNGWKDVWTVMFPNASFGDPSYRLPNKGCVRYGKAPEGAESSDAAPLVAGKCMAYPSWEGPAPRPIPLRATRQISACSRHPPGVSR